MKIAQRPQILIPLFFILQACGTTSPAATPVGTDDGLNRYDGYSFTVFKPDTDNPASLSDRSITAIVEDPKWSCSTRPANLR